MGLSQQIAYVGDECGRPSRDVMDDHLVTGWLLADVDHYNRRITTAGKVHLTISREFTITTRRGTLTPTPPAILNTPHFVRILLNRTQDSWDFVDIAEDIQEIDNANGQRMIYFYGVQNGVTLKYYASWVPPTAGDTLELWYENDAAAIASLAASPSFPTRFHRMVGCRTLVHRALPHLLLTDSAKYNDFVKIKMPVALKDLDEAEQDFSWYLYGAPGQGGDYQNEPYDPMGSVPTWTNRFENT